MSSHLIVSETRRECEGCAAIIRPGIVAMTDEIHGEGYPTVPQCPECLKSLDPRLAAAWAMLRHYGSLSALDQHIISPAFSLPGDDGA